MVFKGNLVLYKKLHDRIEITNGLRGTAILKSAGSLRNKFFFSQEFALHKIDILFIYSTTNRIESMVN